MEEDMMGYIIVVKKFSSITTLLVSVLFFELPYLLHG